VLEDLWNGILDLTSKLVIPDWGALIALIPVGLLIVIAVWLILLVRRFATAGPTRRGKRRIKPVPPPGIHMPGGSFAPILAAIGAFFLFWGLVVGGVWLWIGVAAIVATLLVWGAEGLRDYDHLDGTHVAALPAPAHAGPPPGVHMPGPSFRPILGALGVTVLFFGLVFGGWLLLVGIILTIWTLLGWLWDARKEYVKTVQADETGHVENIPEPHWPRRVLWVGALLIAIALLVDNGIVPPRSDTAAGGGGGEPGASGEPGGGSGGEQPGGSGPPAVDADATVVSQGIAFDVKEISIAADEAFTIHHVNGDPAGTIHDIDIRDGAGETLQDQPTVDGGAEQTYDYEPLAAGSYVYICSIHPVPAMTGTLTVE
jgi:plastocyanin